MPKRSNAPSSRSRAREVRPTPQSSPLPGGATFEPLEGRVLLSAASAHVARPAPLTIHRSAQHQAPGLPKATLQSALGVDDAGQVSMTLRVRYTDAHGIDPTSFGVDDVSIGNDLTVTSAVASGTSKRGAVVTYTASGADDPSAAVKGKVSYTVSLSAGGVLGADGSAAGAQALGLLMLKLDPAAVVTPPVTDPTPPVAQTISAPYLTSTGVSIADVQIQYTDAQGVDLSSIVPGNVVVGQSNLSVAGVTTTVSDGGKTVIATYGIPAPSGTFTVNDDGSYILSLNPAAPVRDVAGLTTAQDTNLGPMHIAIAPPVPTADPDAGVTVSTFGVNTTSVTVTYHDDLGIDLDTLSPDNLSFASSNSLRVTAISVNSSDGNKTVAATYTFAAPDGISFKHADNGVYQIELNPSSVYNTSSVSVAGTSGSWETITVAVPDPSTATIPTASVASAPYLTQAGATQVQIQIAYHDALGIDTSTIVPGNLTLPLSNFTVDSVTTSVSNGGKDVVATYVIPAPSGTFTVDDDGSYLFGLSAQSPVKNIAGLSVPVDALGNQMFHITIPPD